MTARTVASDHPGLSICAGVYERALDCVKAGRTVGPAKLDTHYVEVACHKYKVDISIGAFVAVARHSFASISGLRRAAGPYRTLPCVRGCTMHTATAQVGFGSRGAVSAGQHGVRLSLVSGRSGRTFPVLPWHQTSPSAPPMSLPGHKRHKPDPDHLMACAFHAYQVCSLSKRKSLQCITPTQDSGANDCFRPCRVSRCSDAELCILTPSRLCAGAQHYVARVFRLNDRSTHVCAALQNSVAVVRPSLKSAYLP